MHKVIVINLNGNAYQVDEVGYDDPDGNGTGRCGI